MAISLLEQKKKQKFLLPILGAIVLAMVVVIWLGFFRASPAAPPANVETVPAVQRIVINWDTLKNPILEILEPFSAIPPLPGNYGRKNPFLPY